MNITPKKAPWHRKNQGARHNPDPRYHSREWKALIVAFKQTNQMVICKDGTVKLMSNSLCIECFREGTVREGYALDHIKRVKDGAEFYGLENKQMLCKYHHAVKSAREAQIKP